MPPDFRTGELMLLMGLDRREVGFGDAFRCRRWGNRCIGSGRLSIDCLEARMSLFLSIYRVDRIG
jgi:hypothetical protein